MMDERRYHEQTSSIDNVAASIEVQEPAKEQLSVLGNNGKSTAIVAFFPEEDCL